MIAFTFINYCGMPDSEVQFTIEDSVDTDEYIEFVKNLSAQDIVDEFEYETSNDAISACEKFITYDINAYIEYHNSNPDKLAYLWLDKIYKIIIYNMDEYKFIDMPPKRSLGIFSEMIESYFEGLKDITPDTTEYFNSGGPELLVIAAIDLIPKGKPTAIIQFAK